MGVRDAMVASGISTVAVNVSARCFECVASDRRLAQSSHDVP